MARAEQGHDGDASQDGDEFLAKVHAEQQARHYLLRQRHLALMARVLELEKSLTDLG